MMVSHNHNDSNSPHYHLTPTNVSISLIELGSLFCESHLVMAVDVVATDLTPPFDSVMPARDLAGALSFIQ